MTRSSQRTPVKPRAGRTLRVLGATSTGLIAVGAVTAATLLAGPWASALGAPAADAGAATVAVDPAPALLVCPAPARLPEGLSVGDSQFSATPVDTRSNVLAGVLGAAGGSATWAPLGGDAEPLDAGAAAAVTVRDAIGGSVVEALPGADGAFREAGATTSMTTAGDLRGLAAAPCAAPAISQWIVGGGTEVGSTAVLTVQNPSARTATVTLDVYGPSGRVPLGSRGAFLVGPGESVETHLEAVAPDQRRVAVHVRSTGARVSASLQVQSLAGLLPRGVDLLAPGSAPATSVAVAGIVSDGQPLDDPHAPVLRLLAPDDAAGTARVSVYGQDGIVRLRGTEDVELVPGAVTDVPLGGLPAGGYSLVVDADVPVVAAVGYFRSATTPDDAVVQGSLVDVAWVPGQALPAPGDAQQVAVPAGTRAVLSVGAVPETRDGTDPAGDDTTAVVRVVGTDGTQLAERELTLTPGRLQRLVVADLVDGGTPALVTVDGGDVAPVVWGLELSTGDGESPQALVSTLAPTAGVEGAAAVRVRAVDARG
ncbi:hypothetical protein Xcel_2547 [Xylanimonas cellulosilytica DSM 15894]|uniref:Secreted protein n=1 Tax=Xylanimonas cellulosilytica (strain DSM 15894 / JCM 12276 / CECT 5975 / KCTC 9989 / LMG 20990 / NBRC 107835 / XIL07) TaxID=446471 RepID=D1BWZ4_XYLCX|nr:DUF5719 family protein [Xylanimonas cellulosilytica]ACZ31562.1 hypothetical protein Xcel_2547 [Xylanimonas cellulosilytica DSM 15894]